MFIKKHKKLAVIALAAVLMAAPVTAFTASAEDAPNPDAGKVELVYGDIDGDGTPTSNDALLALRQSLGLDKEFTEIQFLVADVDEAGTITANDALLILRYSLGFEDGGIVAEHFKKYLGA